MAKDHSTSHILQSLVVNGIIAVLKAVAAFFTKSGSMLAEAIHSFADCGNQLLLLRGVSESQKPADEKHPLGYGRNTYFWSFMVAMLLFSVGGMFSIYEGIHKLQHPEPVHHVGWAIAILCISIVLEGGATLSNIKEMNKRRGEKSFFSYLRQTKDSDLVVVFGENSAAMIGLCLALICIMIAAFADYPQADAIGSLLVGIVLIIVAVFLAIEVKSLLVGEAADPQITNSIHQLMNDYPEMTHAIKIITVQQGPGEVVLCMKVGMSPTMTMENISKTINRFEIKLREIHPEVKWIYIEPDVYQTA